MGTEPQHTADACTTDALFEIMANQRRRRVLAYFRDNAEEGPIGVDDLSRQLTPPDADGSDADDVAATLHHVHLPKLDEAGFVDYDAAANVVVPVEGDRVPAFGSDPFERGTA